MTGARRGSARPQRHAAHRAEHDQPDLGDRCSNDTASGLWDQPAQARANRGAIRLGQDYRRARPAHAAPSRVLEIQVHSDKGYLRLDPIAQVARLAYMISRTGHHQKPHSKSNGRSRRAIGTNFSGLLGVRPARCLIRLGRQQVKYQLPALSRSAVDARSVASLGWWALFRAETAYWPRFLSGLTFGTTTVRRKASQFSGDS
jgi:hypothetical protein